MPRHERRHKEDGETARLALDGRKKMSGLCACRYVSYIFVSVSVSL